MIRLRLACAALALMAMPLYAQPKPKKAKPVAPPGPTVDVPYRLTGTQHVMVRVKLDGVGPFNFIIDTGAPVLFLSPKVAEKARLTPDANGWVTVPKFELEGGVVIANARGKSEELFQINGMNGIGIAGVELHGVIGYNLLARYRITYDFTRDTLGLQKLEFEPPNPVGHGGKGGQGGMEAIGPVVKLLGALAGMKPNFATAPRGFAGLTSDSEAKIVSIVPGGPAAVAGLHIGDRITKLNERAIHSADDLTAALAKLPAGQTITFAIERDGRPLDLALALGKGL